MAVSDEFLNYVLDQLSALGGVSARRMFGGAGLYRGGRIFGLIADDVAYLRADESNRRWFIKAGSTKFNPYPDIVKTASVSYYTIPVQILESRDELCKWAERSLRTQKSGAAGPDRSSARRKARKLTKMP